MRYALGATQQAIRSNVRLLGKSHAGLRWSHDELRRLGFPNDLIVENLLLLGAFNRFSRETIPFLLRKGLSHQQIAEIFSVVEQKPHVVEKRYKALNEGAGFTEETIASNPWLLRLWAEDSTAITELLRSHVGIDTKAAGETIVGLYAFKLRELEMALNSLFETRSLREVRENPTLLFDAAKGMYSDKPLLQAALRGREQRLKIRI